MAKYDKEEGVKQGLSRRDFLKTGAAAAAVGAAGLDFAVAPSMAAAATVDATYHTTCPYCSASCGQLVDVDVDKNVIDVYGDYMSPFNQGGLCAKGAGAFQLVTNKRRIGAYAGTHPVNPVFAANPAFTEGVAYRRIEGTSDWTAMDLQTAMEEAAVRLKGHRDDEVVARGYADWTTGLEQYDSKGVVFFGSSHMNNESNYVYRKLIANFGTTDTEHQARI
ncbi:MAG: twin-arginine translocation signal domain-containing protein [Actinobacteria bacterium]|nr:twin-arginine translocation signal domain-containing protein [Actinomycetota bacterium]MCG2808183.1 twin-arginine translocation signal domain-containing protein [Coriobacteriia bacterium]